jgi:ornithine cyclodeaminase/alanine dehydrogenase-like protein (mu-crystallin family)
MIYLRYPYTSMLSMDEAEVRRRLDPILVIAAIESAFRERYPSMTIPVRTHMNIAGGTFLVMSCYDTVRHALGMKLVTVRDNPARPEDRIQATYMLIDPESARPRMTIPANYLTDLRTAATSAVATKFLARTDVRVLGIFGTGRQARAHLRVLPLVRQFQRVLVCGTDSRRSREFAQHMAAELPIPIEPVDAPTCAGQSDVLCTCTCAQSPLFDGNLLRPGTHLNLVGTFQPHAREVDSITIQRAQVVVETHNGPLAEAGDLLIPISEGLISRQHVLADLHELLSGKKSARRTSADITLFKSVGCALEDLVTAELLLACK